MEYHLLTLRMPVIRTKIRWKTALLWSWRNWDLEEHWITILWLTRYRSTGKIDKWPLILLTTVWSYECICVWNSKNIKVILCTWKLAPNFDHLTLRIYMVEHWQLCYFSFFLLNTSALTFPHTWQSRVGPIQWLKPYTDEVLVELGQKGVKSLLAVPVR
jgi:hypothetical protein